MNKKRTIAKKTTLSLILPINQNVISASVKFAKMIEHRFYGKRNYFIGLLSSVSYLQMRSLFFNDISTYHVRLLGEKLRTMVFQRFFICHFFIYDCLAAMIKSICGKLNENDY